ncbi:MAG: RDD family protein [Woeseiaceae bacterium]|nr:RDD family protein [Woeseiaceae bacterium]
MQNAGLARRLAAIVYDTLLVIALLFLATIPFIALRGGEHVEPGSSPAYQLALGAVVYLFFVGYWTRAGSTLGMQSWRLRLETADGGLPTVRAATVRFLVAIISWAALGIGFLWSLVDRDGLAWHDRASGTRLRHYPKTKSMRDGG